MKKIRIYLIHLLGGVTKRESSRAHIKKSIKLVNKTLPLGSLVAVRNLKGYADSLNGIHADEWCKRMYNAITADVEKYEKMFDKAKENDEHENNEPEQTETTDTAHSEADK